MGTRSALARPAGDGWEGVYCHWDGYPTHNGAALWRIVNERFAGDGAALADMLVNDGRPWSGLDPDAQAADPKDGAEYVSGIGARYTRSPGDAYTRLREHGPCGDTCDPLFIEWVYVLRRDGMTVLTSVKGDAGYYHIVAGDVLWNDEPDWAALEARRDQLNALTTSA